MLEELWRLEGLGRQVLRQCLKKAARLPEAVRFRMADDLVPVCTMLRDASGGDFLLCQQCSLGHQRALRRH